MYTVVIIHVYKLLIGISRKTSFTGKMGQVVGNFMPHI